MPSCVAEPTIGPSPRRVRSSCSSAGGSQAWLFYAGPPPLLGQLPGPFPHRARHARRCSAVALTPAGSQADIVSRQQRPQLLAATAYLSDAHEAALRGAFAESAFVRQPQRGGAQRGVLVPTLRQEYHYFSSDKAEKVGQRIHVSCVWVVARAEAVVARHIIGTEVSVGILEKGIVVSRLLGAVRDMVFGGARRLCHGRRLLVSQLLSVVRRADEDVHLAQGTTMVFCDQPEEAERVAGVLGEAMPHLGPRALHAGLDDAAREQAWR